MVSDGEGGSADLSFEAFHRSFSYGDHADMQFKYLARMSDEATADATAAVLAAVGETLDTGDLDALREVVYRAQVGGYLPAEPVTPTTEIPFSSLPGPLAGLTLALVSAGGVHVADDDPSAS